MTGNATSSSLMTILVISGFLAAAGFPFSFLIETDFRACQSFYDSLSPLVLSIEKSTMWP